MKKIITIALLSVMLGVSCSTLSWKEKTQYEKTNTVATVVVLTGFSALTVVWAVNFIKAFFTPSLTVEQLEKARR